MNKMDSTLTSMWVSFFTAAGIPSDVAASYALTFAENRIQNDMLLDLNKEYLRDMGITRMGDVIAILRHARLVHESLARDKVLGSTINMVPVAAITGRATIAQNKPVSPASRILEHYTRNAREAPVSPTHTHTHTHTHTLQKKRKIDAVIETTDPKKSRLIRFGSPQPAVNEVAQTKTVFARLGQTEAVKPNVSTKDVKPIYARLGSKTKDQPAIPVQRDALKYEGILKSPPVAKKVVTITTTKNSVRQIAMGCTMRADEEPISVKEKLAVPKSKSVKFSNHVEYKEIETVQERLVQAKIQPKQTKQTVFNKPERRLSMPDNTNLWLSMPDNTNVRPSMPDNKNVRPSMRDNTNVRPSMRDNTNVRPSMRDNTNVRPSMRDNTNVRPSMRDNTNVRPSMRDNTNVRPSMPDITNVRLSMPGNTNVRLSMPGNTNVRPSMPDNSNVKARLGVKRGHVNLPVKNANNITITKNVFKRLGV